MPTTLSVCSVSAEREPEDGGPTAELGIATRIALGRELLYGGGTSTRERRWAWSRC
jgi:hypothetical protein